jgi:hypothetical protein
VLSWGLWDGHGPPCPPQHHQSATTDGVGRANGRLGTPSSQVGIATISSRQPATRPTAPSQLCHFESPLMGCRGLEQPLRPYISLWSACTQPMAAPCGHCRPNRPCFLHLTSSGADMHPSQRHLLSSLNSQLHPQSAQGGVNVPCSKVDSLLTDPSCLSFAALCRLLSKVASN